MRDRRPRSIDCASSRIVIAWRPLRSWWSRLAIGASVAVSTFALVRALRAEDQTRRQLTASLVAQGMRKVDEADPLTGLVYLTRALELETDPDRIRSHRIRIGEILQRSPRLVGLWRHESTIHMLAVSSRGLVASGSTDGVVSIRDLATSEPRVAWIAQGSVIWDGEFSPDGGTLAVASEDGRVRLWNPADGRLVKELTNQSGVVDIAFSPDGASLGAICSDGAVSVWDVRRGTTLFAGKHGGEGRRIEFSHSGAVVATAGEDGARLWRMPGGAPSADVLAHGGAGAIDLAFARDDRWLATGGWDQTARLWDVRTAAAGGPDGGARRRRDRRELRRRCGPARDDLDGRHDKNVASARGDADRNAARQHEHRQPERR